MRPTKGAKAARPARMIARAAICAACFMPTATDLVWAATTIVQAPTPNNLRDPVGVGAATVASAKKVQPRISPRSIDECGSERLTLFACMLGQGQRVRLCLDKRSLAYSLEGLDRLGRAPIALSDAHQIVFPGRDEQDTIGQWKAGDTTVTVYAADRADYFYSSHKPFTEGAVRLETDGRKNLRMCQEHSVHVPLSAWRPADSPPQGGVGLETLTGMRLAHPFPFDPMFPENRGSFNTPENQAARDALINSIPEWP